MKVVTVIPIAKGVPRSELSYFSAKEIPLGTLVTVPFGKRSIKGVVVNAQGVRDLKSSLKQNKFALRNITTVHTDTELSPGIFIAAQKTARHFACPVGPILETMIPDQFFNYYSTHPIPRTIRKPHNPNIQSIQVPFTERISWYKTIIRENFAKNLSTLIITPSVITADTISDHLKTGISDRLITLHSKKTKKYIEKKLPEILSGKDPLVVIATAPFGTLIREDWDTLIIEQSNSPYYRYSFGPIFDMRMFVEELGKSFGSRIIYADTLLESEIHERITQREILDMRSTWHIKKPEDFSMINMKSAGDRKKDFGILDPITIHTITNTIAQKSSIFLLTSRKGLAPLTVCSDCGTTVSCPACGSPLVLHRKNKENSPTPEARIYMCHHCMLTTNPIDRCATCTSWKLTTLGISTESIMKDIEQRFPKTSSYLLDGDHATPAQIKKTITTWQENRSSILVGTPMVIPYLDTIDVGCIVSLDSLLSLPTYTASERALHTTLAFLERCTGTALIQTRLVDHEVIQAITNEDIFGFVKKEIISRKTFGYPPEKTVLKVTSPVPTDQVREATEAFEKIFKHWNPDILVKRSSQPGTMLLVSIMKINPADWKTDENLHTVLEDLAGSSTVEVNPEGVL